MTIEFRKYEVSEVFLNPSDNFKPEHQKVELRRHPLTKRWCRINVTRTQRPRSIHTIISSDLVDTTPANCPFCPDNIEKVTPKFADLADRDRIKVGNSWLFPNKFPFGQNHAVVVLSDEHFLHLDKANDDDLVNTLLACKEYLALVKEQSEEVRYCAIGWNHSASAGAVLLHPHLQILAEERPTLYLHSLLGHSEEYYSKEKSSYWKDIIDTEKKLQERHLLSSDEVDWIASFAPQGHNGIVGIIRDASNMLDLTEKQIKEFSSGVSTILKAYNMMGVNSFNLSIFSGPLAEQRNDFSLHARLISRPIFGEFYTSDSSFMERFHHEPVIETLPEETTRLCKLSMKTP
ncbi:MAG: hypothetical protein V3T40_05960 [Nitrososphaerales archaeon]